MIMIMVTTLSDQLVTLNIDANETVENVKALLEVETGTPHAQQRLVHNGRELQNNSTLSASGVGNGDLIMLVPGEQPSSLSSPSSNPGNPLAMRADGTAMNPQALKVWRAFPAAPRPTNRPMRGNVAERSCRMPASLSRGAREHVVLFSRWG